MEDEGVFPGGSSLKNEGVLSDGSTTKPRSVLVLEGFYFEFIVIFEELKFFFQYNLVKLNILFWIITLK